MLHYFFYDILRHFSSFTTFSFLLRHFLSSYDNFCLHDKFFSRRFVLTPLPRDGTPLLEAPENGPQKHGKRTHLTILVPSSDFGQCQGQVYQVKAWYSVFGPEKSHLKTFNFAIIKRRRRPFKSKPVFLH